MYDNHLAYIVLNFAYKKRFHRKKYAVHGLNLRI